jgi:rhomboid protease GluP
VNKRYRVVIKGARPDLVAEAVIERLAPLFKMTPDMVRPRFMSGSFVVKKAVDRDTAEKYCRYLEERGCVCAIEPDLAAVAPAPELAPAEAAPARPAAPGNALGGTTIKTPALAPAQAAPVPAASGDAPGSASIKTSTLALDAIAQATLGGASIKAPSLGLDSVPKAAPAKPAVSDNALGSASIKTPALGLDPVPAKPNADANQPPAAAAAKQPVGPPYEPPQNSPSFAGRFDLRQTLNRGAKKRHPLSGKGEITFTALGLRIDGKRPRRFWFAAKEDLLIPYADILDARVIGKTVLFSANGLGPERRDVCLAVADADLAWEIKSLLPPRQSEEFVEFQNDERHFNESLEEVGTVPVVTYAVIVVNILVYLMQAKGGVGILFPDPDVLINYGANYGPATLSGEWWRLFTASFVHLGIVNLVFSTIALYKVGRLVEQLYGPVHFALLYVVAGVAGMMASTLWHIEAIGGGASGAIFGVFGGLLAYMVNGANGVPRTIMEEHRHSILVFVGYSLWRGFRRAGVDNAMHIGGLVAGLVMGYLLMRPLNEEARKESAAPKLATAAVAAAVLLGLASIRLLHPGEGVRQDLQFLAQVRLISKAQAKVESDYAALEAQVASGAMTQMQMADPIEKQILPQWQAMNTQLSAIPLSPSSSHYEEEQEMIKNIGDEQRRLLQLAHAIRTNDMTALQGASQAESDLAGQFDSMQDSPDN